MNYILMENMLCFIGIPRWLKLCYFEETVYKIFNKHETEINVENIHCNNWIPINTLKVQ